MRNILFMDIMNFDISAYEKIHRKPHHINLFAFYRLTTNKLNELHQLKRARERIEEWKQTKIDVLNTLWALSSANANKTMKY